MWGRRGKKEGKQQKYTRAKLESYNGHCVCVVHRRKYQSWVDGKLRTSASDLREIKRAKDAGVLSEALLDRRVKLKSDRYCK